MNGVDLIKEERERQISIEGFANDTHYRNDELIRAAICYASQKQHPIWPWDTTWWKPSTKIRNLVKAGALIAAEIDRLQQIS